MMLYDGPVHSSCRTLLDEGRTSGIRLVKAHDAGVCSLVSSVLKVGIKGDYLH